MNSLLNYSWFQQQQQQQQDEMVLLLSDSQEFSFASMCAFVWVRFFFRFACFACCFNFETSSPHWYRMTHWSMNIKIQDYSRQTIILLLLLCVTKIEMCEDKQQQRSSSIDHSMVSIEFIETIRTLIIPMWSIEPRTYKKKCGSHDTHHDKLSFDSARVCVCPILT